MNNPNLKNIAIYGLIGIIIILLIISKCSTSKQADQNAASAVAQNIIDTKNTHIADLEKQNLSIRQNQDRLIHSIDSLNELIIQKDKKSAQIALNYVKEKNRVQKLSNDSATGLFLDRADCSEVPVMKYDSDYIIPIEPIRFYNDMAVDFDALKEQHQNLIDQAQARILQVINLNKVIENKTAENDNLMSIINDKDGVAIQKDKQIVAGKNKLKWQKVKTYVVAGVGVVLLSFSLIR